LAVRLQRHELLSLISAAGFELSCYLVQRASAPEELRGLPNLGRDFNFQPDAVTETGPRRHRRRHARLLSFLRCTDDCSLPAWRHQHGNDHGLGHFVAAWLWPVSLLD
jgi:hypothetical protein